MIVWSDGRKYELRDVEVAALKALQVGYEPIQRMHGLNLYVLGLCTKSIAGYKISALGERCLKEGGISEDVKNDDGGHKQDGAAAARPEVLVASDADGDRGC